MPKKNKMKLFKIFAAIAVFTITFTSCKKDKENPVITVSKPEQHTNFKWGDKVHVSAAITDDRDLKHLHIFVGDMDGNHNHQFDFMSSTDISGESYDFHDHFEVPADAPDKAWIYFEAEDAEGKKTELKWMLHFSE